MSLQIIKKDKLFFKYYKNNKVSKTLLARLKGENFWPPSFVVIFIVLLTYLHVLSTLILRGFRDSQDMVCTKVCMLLL